MQLDIHEAYGGTHSENTKTQHLLIFPSHFFLLTCDQIKPLKLKCLTSYLRAAIQKQSEQDIMNHSERQRAGQCCKNRVHAASSAITASDV